MVKLVKKRKKLKIIPKYPNEKKVRNGLNLYGFIQITKNILSITDK